MTLSVEKLIEPGYAGGNGATEVEDKEYDEPVWRYSAKTADHTGYSGATRSATRHCLFLMGCLLI